MHARLALGLGLASLVLAPVASELRVHRAAQPLTNRWRSRPVAPRGATRLGISFRPPQVEALGLDGPRTLRALLEYPLQVVRLGAYWNHIEPRPDLFDTASLDWQVEAAQIAGKHIVLCVGAVKTFGYPEFFVPRHRLPRPLPERTRIRPDDFASLLAAATEFIGRVVERYKTCTSIIAWQVEHESVDPLGMEHSWRLDRSFVEREVQTVRRADPSRPILMNGYLPVSLPVRLTQWWATRDQGDSLAAAEQLADIVGIDYYPRHALIGLGDLTLYLDGRRSPWQGQRRRALFARLRQRQRPLMISEGQAEPWEAVTTPPSLPGRVMYSCRPEDIIDNYTTCLGWARQADVSLADYLFWGAEYWVLRQQQGDPSYVQAFARILDES
jgi:hypothetical protein